ncbi:MAG: hypoxanthine phosphoribosyltransferase [Elusimicrobia bacterium]|nr:hypoxanthine phosphoribosyltransferase [Elusimicrobiota bacterium]
MPSHCAEPEIKEILISREKIQSRVRELGEEISRDYAGKPLMLIGVLKGSFIFLADLMRHITIPCSVEFICLSSYEGGTESTGIVRMLLDLRSDSSGREVLIVEDIVDSGLTLNYLMDNLRTRHPASLEVCTLLNKPEERKIPVPVKYTGFEIPNKFVVGYGLDFQECYRNLSYIGVLKV